MSIDRVRVAVVAADQDLRQSVKLALSRVGFRRIADFHSWDGAEAAIAGDEAEMVVADASVHLGSGGVQRIRRRRLGSDPFLAVVSLLPGDQPGLVKGVVNSGSDDVVLCPFTTDALGKRLVSVAMRRKQFVATHDYVGPDRRLSGREPAARLFTVPHPVLARASGTGREDYMAEVDRVWREIAAERTRSLASHLCREGRELFLGIKDGSVPRGAVPGRVLGISQLVEEIKGLGCERNPDVERLSLACAHAVGRGAAVSFPDLEQVFVCSAKLPKALCA